MAERVRKIGGTTLRSIGQIGQEQTIEDNEDDFVAPSDMLRELMNDHKKIVKFMREAHGICDDHEDIATASLIEIWIDEAEKRLWFLFEAGRSADRRAIRPLLGSPSSSNSGADLRGVLRNHVAQ